MRAAIAKDIQAEISGTQESENRIIPQIRIPIERLISERYLYSLTKEIEKSLSGSLGTGVILSPEYATFDNIRIVGSDFIFAIGANQPIAIPMSSYLFDIWNNRLVSIVSGEILSGENRVTPIHQKVIALTFDDGPSPLYTERLLDTLKREAIHVTFFVLGRNAALYPDIVKREHSE